MDKLIKEFKYTASLTADWKQDFVHGLGGTITDNKLMNFPLESANGSGYFINISDGVSVLVLDLILEESLRFTRIPSEEDFWVLHYDMSDNFSKHYVDDVKYNIGYKSKLGFAIIDSHLSSTYISPVGERTYSLRLYIQKTFFKSFYEEIALENDFKNIFGDKIKKKFCYGHMDSRSKVILYSLKQHSMVDANYEFLLKGSIYKLLAYFVERLNSNGSNKGLFLEKDLDAIMKAQEYLLSNLFLPYPGLIVLSKIANMSISKFRSLYFNVFGISSASFLKNEKLILAKELLESGEFKLISDVAYELGYNKVSHFSIIYKKHHGHLPNVVFKAKLQSM